MRLSRRVLWVSLVLGVGALLLGGIGLALAGRSPDVGRVPATPVAAVGRPAPPEASRVVAVDRSAATTRSPSSDRPRPVRVQLPRLGIDAPVVAVTVGADGLLGVPDDPRQLGWWRGGAGPADRVGSVVIDGHVDSATRGLGALFQLGTSRPGDEVHVSDSRGHSTRYTVVAVRRYAKSAVPAADVFAQDVWARLVLVTCGGRFDTSTRHYADNIVVYAVPR